MRWRCVVEELSLRRKSLPHISAHFRTMAPPTTGKGDCEGTASRDAARHMLARAFVGFECVGDAWLKSYHCDGNHCRTFRLIFALWRHPRPEKAIARELHRAMQRGTCWHAHSWDLNALAMRG